MSTYVPYDRAGSMRFKPVLAGHLYQLEPLPLTAEEDYNMEACTASPFDLTGYTDARVMITTRRDVNVNPDWAALAGVEVNPLNIIRLRFQGVDGAEKPMPVTTERVVEVQCTDTPESVEIPITMRPDGIGLPPPYLWIAAQLWSAPVTPTQSWRFFHLTYRVELRLLRA